MTTTTRQRTRKGTRFPDVASRGGGVRTTIREAGVAPKHRARLSWACRPGQSRLRAGTGRSIRGLRRGPGPIRRGVRTGNRAVLPAGHCRRSQRFRRPDVRVLETNVVISCPQLREGGWTSAVQGSKVVKVFSIPVRTDFGGCRAGIGTSLSSPHVPCWAKSSVQLCRISSPSFLVVYC